MTPQAATAERRHEVRKAALSWRGARWIDDVTLRAVLERYPDDRVRVKPAFRVLLFCFTVFAVLAAAGLLGVLGAGTTTLCLVMGAASFALTELQVSHWRRAQGGTEGATSLLAVLFLVAFVIALFEDAGGTRDFLRVLTLLCAIFFAAASWRWGFAIYGGFAAAFAFGFLACFPEVARISWALFALVLLPLGLAGSRSARLPPSHRGACAHAVAVAGVALYAAVHVTSYEIGLLEELTRPLPSISWRVSAFLTALVPAGFLVWGVVKRSKLLLHLGGVTAVASLVTLRYYVHVAPLWLVLIASGGATILASLLLRRYLRAGAHGERNGFTSEPLFDESRGALLELGAVAATAGPGPRTGSEEPAFKGAGGDFGGGGASGSF